MEPIRQRFVQSVILDATGAGTVSVTVRGDFLLMGTRWKVGTGTATNIAQSTAQTAINGDDFEGTYAGNNDASSTVHLMLASDILTCQWTGGQPGQTATLTLRGFQYPAGQGLKAIGGGGAGGPPAGTGPGNPILGGDTLIRNAIQSPNFVSGSVGWRIGRDDSAEFNNIVARGELDVNGTANAYLRVFNLQGTGPTIQLYPGDFATAIQNANPFFDTDVSNWTGIGGAIAWDPFSFTGAGSLKLTPNGVSATARTECEQVLGAVPGAPWGGQAWVYCAVARNVSVSLRWFDSNGILLSTTPGAVTPVAANTWTRLTVTGTAPALTARASITVDMTGTPAPSNILNVDIAQCFLVTYNLSTVAGITTQKQAGPPHNGQLVLFPPGYGSHGNLTLTGDSYEGTQGTSADFGFDVVSKNGVDLGGGNLVFDTATGTVGPSSSATDVIVMTAPGAAVSATRRYRVGFDGTIASGVVSDRIGFRIFVGGVQIADFGQVPITVANVGQPFHFEMGLTGVAAADVTLRARLVAGTGPWTVQRRFVQLDDVKGL